MSCSPETKKKKKKSDLQITPYPVPNTHPSSHKTVSLFIHTAPPLTLQHKRAFVSQSALERAWKRYFFCLLEMDVSRFTYRDFTPGLDNDL